MTVQHRSMGAVKYSSRTLFALLPLLLIIYLLIQAQVVVQFERFLSSRTIEFSDFPAAYTTTLIEATKAHEQPDFPFPRPTTNDSSSIPPIIHYIWFRDLYSAHLDISAIPSSGSKAPGVCRERNPDFEINIWNATAARALLEEHYAWFLPTYDSYRHPIQRVDAFKYFVLWHRGGIYMDLDIECRRALDALLPFPAWFPKARPYGVNNDLMAARKHHPVIWLMLHRLAPRNLNLLFPYLTIFWSTGPQFTSDVLRLWWRGTYEAHPGPDTFRILPIEFYSEEYTFFGHMPGGTWHGGDVAVILWLVDRPWLFALAPMALMAGFMTWLRLRRRRRLMTRRS